MSIKLKENLSHKKTLWLLAVLCALLGALSCAFGELLLPFLTGVLAALYLFDKNGKGVFSLCVSVLLIILNAAAVFFGLSVSMFGLSAPLLAVLICFAFNKGQSKADTAYVMTLICAGFSVLTCILLGMVMQNVYTLDAAVAFYTDLLDYVKSVFVSTAMQIYSETGLEITEELIASSFDQQISMIISYLVIFSFATIGIAMKIFSFTASRCADDSSGIKEWRFLTTNVYAYFYVILALVSVFVYSTDSLFGISVLNLYNIFMVVFAYVGFNYALSLLRRRMKKWSSFIFLAVLTVMFSSLAIQFLAFLGVIFTIRKSRETGSLGT